MLPFNSGFRLWSIDVNPLFEVSPEEKSAGVKSGDHSYQETSPEREINLLENASLRTAMVYLALCGVAPSC